VRRRTAAALAAAFAATATAPSAGAAPPFARTEERAPCAHHDPLRRPFFGDTHVHTAFSFDAWGQGTRNTPRDAYRFARGEAVGIQPYDAEGRARRRVWLRRPLDFAMVSDHAEMLGETALCDTPGSPSYDAFTCVLLRRWPKLGYMIVNSQWSSTDGGRKRDVCGEDGALCRDAAAGPWRATREAAEEFYDRSSACRFTTFVGFEWSGSRVGMIHRNVVFRNAAVPERLPNAIDDRHDETRLWQRLLDECIETDTGCDALAIPHNPNWSRGSLFWTTAPDGTPLSPELAARRAALEPLVEITQHKGDSECRAGGSDELCSFETPRFGDLAGHASPLYRTPVPPRVYVREALLEGLVQRARIGVNPFRLGVIGATDTHLGTPGQVAEEGFAGHAAGVVSARLEVPPLPDHPLFNPGGLGAVWAEENSRDAIFAAMRRRETYGTSGPRMVVRLFAGWDHDESLCDAADFAARGYAGGVPMGGELGAPPETDAPPAPRIAVRALRDPGTPELPGAPLERIQIVKGWLDDGEPRQRVFDVAGEAGPGVDPRTCAFDAGRPGADALCAVWRDPDFDPDAPAFYYARVVQSPTCRWTTLACREAAVDCDAALGPRGLLAACCDPAVPKTLRERAWTSPVWYAPEP